MLAGLKFGTAGGAATTPVASTASSPPSRGSPSSRDGQPSTATAQREEWMLEGGDSGPNRMREERERRRQHEVERQQQEAEQREARLAQAEQHKARGGLQQPRARPGVDSSAQTSHHTTVGDGGLSWRRKAEQRAREQEATREPERHDARATDMVQDDSRQSEKGQQQGNRDRQRERAGFRRPDTDSSHNRLSASSSASSLSSLRSSADRTPSPSPDSASSASSSGWRERIRERREGRTKDASEQSAPFMRALSAPSPPPTLTEQERLRERQRSLEQRTRFAGLHGDDGAAEDRLTSVTEELDEVKESLPSFMPQSVSLGEQPIIPSSASPRQSAAPPVSDADRATEINKLAAQAVKAKLRKDMARYDELQQHIATLKQQSTASVTLSSPTAASPSPSAATSAASLPAQLSHNEHDHVHGNVVILSQLDASNRPLLLPSQQRDQLTHPAIATPATSSTTKRRPRHVEKMEAGERVAWRDDDVNEHKSVMQMAEEERVRKDDEDSRYDEVYARNVMHKRRYREESMDDAFDSLDSSLGLYQSKRSRLSEQQRQQHNEQQQRRETDRYNDVMTRCELCADSGRFVRELVVAVGVRLFLSMPRVGVVDGLQCVLSSIEHTVAQTEFDETMDEELDYFQQHLTRLYAKLTPPLTPLYIETVIHRQQRRHTQLHCIPLTADEDADAAIIIRQAMADVEGDWCTHRPVIDVKPGKGHGVRRAVPDGFPYCYIGLGGQGPGGAGGYVHVIEREDKWDEEWALELVRGIKGQDSRGGRRGAGGRESRVVEAERVRQFKQLWEPFDWTKKLIKNQPAGVTSAHMRGPDS